MLNGLARRYMALGSVVISAPATSGRANIMTARASGCTNAAKSTASGFYDISLLAPDGKWALEDVDQHNLKQLLEPIWHKKTEAAAKSLSRMNLVLKQGAALGLDVDLQATQKARVLLGKQRHTVKHIPALPYQEALAFYQMCSTNKIARLVAT